jgi:hypothetical protein
LFGLAFIFVFALLGLNIWAIVDVARRNEHDFKAIKSDKTMWLVLVLLAGLPAAIAYLAAVRPRLESPPPQVALPGWYPDPSAPGYVRYHDGASWTAAITPMLPPAQHHYPPQAYPPAPPAPPYPSTPGHPAQAYYPAPGPPPHPHAGPRAGGWGEPPSG